MLVAAREEAPTPGALSLLTRRYAVAVPETTLVPLRPVELATGIGGKMPCVPLGLRVSKLTVGSGRMGEGESLIVDLIVVVVVFVSWVVVVFSSVDALCETRHEGKQGSDWVIGRSVTGVEIGTLLSQVEITTLGTSSVLTLVAEVALG